MPREPVQPRRPATTPAGQRRGATPDAPASSSPAPTRSSSTSSTSSPADAAGGRGGGDDQEQLDQLAGGAGRRGAITNPDTLRLVIRSVVLAQVRELADSLGADDDTVRDALQECVDQWDAE